MVEYFLYRLVRLVVSCVPLGAAYRLGAGVSFFYYHFLRKKERGILKDNLRVVFPNWSDREIEECARDNFREFGKFIAEFFRLDRLTPAEMAGMVEVCGEENIERAIGAGRGVLVVAGHIGNWELGAAFFAFQRGPIHAIALDHEQEKVNALFISQRQSRGVSVISVNAGMKKIFRVLKDRQVIAMLGDRDVTGLGMKVDFFGKCAVFPRGAPVLCCRTGAPMLPVFNIRQADGRYRMIVHEHLTAAGEGGGEAAERKLLEKWKSVFEEYVRKYPSQWFMYHEVWKK